MIRSAVVTGVRSLAARGLVAGLLAAVAALLALPLQAVTLVNNLSEDTSAQMTVGGDSNNDTLAYSLEGADAARFGIITTTGQLRTRAGEKYDFEAQPSYAVRTRVVDGNGGADTIDVTVNVNNNSGETPLEPAAPTVTTTPGSMTGLDVSWVAPGNSGRPAITGNDLRYRAGAGGGWTDGPQGVTGTSASITLFLSRSTVSFSKPANSGIVFSNPTNLGSDCKTLKVIGLYVLQFQPEPVPGRNGTE